jgi:molybdate transport system substrate-binding protein
MIIQRRRLAAIFLACHLGGTAVHADDILVYAAASTALALEETIHRYSKISGDRVRASYASSGALARQLDNGAPASLYLSANTRWMDWIEKKGLLAAGTRIHLVRNRLVLVRAIGKTTRPIKRDLSGWLAKAQGHHLAIADPTHAPAGEYAKQALTSLGFWPSLSTWTVRAQNVSAALLLVARKEVPFGIVYDTDVRSRKNIETLAAFPENSHRPIFYDLAIVKNRDNDVTRRFYDFLKSERGVKIFRRFGFLLP